MTETPRLLLIDDDEILRELLAMRLEVEGFDVTPAADGEEGLRALRAGRFAVVLLDLMMPVMDGLRFMRAVEEEFGAAPPTILLSANPTAVGDPGKLPFPVSHIVRKPVEIEELLRCIRAAAGREG